MHMATNLEDGLNRVWLDRSMDAAASASEAVDEGVGPHVLGVDDNGTKKGLLHLGNPHLCSR